MGGGLGSRARAGDARQRVGVLGVDPQPRFISVNLSPELLLDERLAVTLDGVDPHRVVIEITEHSRIDDYDSICTAIDRLRHDGFRFAIDDTGAGFAGLQQVINLRPEFIKLDLQLTRGIDADPVRRVVAVALARVALELGAVIVAEGIENDDERRVLQQLGIPFGQGFLLARPQPLDSIDWSLPPHQRVAVFT